ncbi:hypothetical protein BDR26DRAFT_1002530 [Obelidium mucronatum]|nr:hypothetical protein BDR26DRAFT_1002530 [Obelidium mucronatum]
MPHLQNQPTTAMEKKPTGGLIYFGGQSIQERKPTHGPGLAASIYSDMLLNLEKKKASQRELAAYEKIQMKERAETKSRESTQKLKEESNIQWLLEKRSMKRDLNPSKVGTAWNDSQKFEPWNQPPRHHESRRMKPPSNSDHHHFDLINHSRKPELKPNPLQRRSYKAEDIKELCPLNGPASSSKIVIQLLQQDTKAHRQRTDVVQRKEPGPNNRLHDPSKDDPNEPAYFHFGRPGAGAPILDGPTKSKVDARLLAYKGDTAIEKLRVIDLLRC